MSRRILLFAICFILTVTLLPAEALAAGPRTALVIGNSAYAEKPLRNPINDATDMANLLKGLGFDVILKINASLAQMEQGVDEFWAKLKNGGVGLFYFAGHGIQVNGKNFLIPVDFRGVVEQDVKSRAMTADLVLGRMENAGNELNIIILDSCRNNPYSRAFRSETEGLAVMDAPTGSLLAFSTAPGTVASDGSGMNGLYTSYLLKEMSVPGLPVEELFKRVRIGVMRDTAKKQVPWETSSLTGQFVFAEGSPPVKKLAKQKDPSQQNSSIPTMGPSAQTAEIQALQDDLAKQEAAAAEAKSKAERKKIEIVKASLRKKIVDAQLEKAHADAEAKKLDIQAQYQAHEPPLANVTFEDLKNKAKAKSLAEAENKKRWDTWLNGMKQAVSEAQAFEKSTSVGPSEKSEAWTRVEKAYSDKNPFSAEDDYLQEVITARKNFWLAEAGNQQDKMKSQSAVMPKQQSVANNPQEQFVTLKTVQTPAAPQIGDTRREPITGMEFVWIPKGCFQMGDTFGAGKDDEKPVHEKCIPGFWMGKYVVTKKQWSQIMGSKESEHALKVYFNNDPDFSELIPQTPIVSIQYNEIRKYIQLLEKKNKKLQFRLPSEAEWEYACRSGGKNELYAGGSDADKVAWHFSSNRLPGPLGSSSFPQPVGLLEPNGLKLYDMSGNVGQMVEDKYDQWAYKKTIRGLEVASDGPNVVRGSGSFLKEDMRCSSRSSGYANYNIGFRLVLINGNEQ